MADNVIDYGQYSGQNHSIQSYPTTYTRPRTVTKEKTTVTKEFDSKGRVTKEIKVTEIETETFVESYPYYTITNSNDVKYGYTAKLTKAKD